MTNVLSPLSDKSATSLTEDFLNINSSEAFKEDETDYVFRDPDTKLNMLAKYPQIKTFSLRHSTTFPSS